MTEYAQPRFLAAGDRAVTVELGNEISAEINARVHLIAFALDRLRWPGIVDVVPSYRSLLIYYDPLRLGLPELQDRILHLGDLDEADLPARRVIEIPTRYGGEYGPDMDFVARHTGLTPDEVAAIHASTEYLVYMMGFNTGYPYLGGMSPRIAVPRLETPRTRVPAGSVGIAQQQTGIYPVESPGGWQLIGRSPVRLFNPELDPPVTIRAGDYLKFMQIDDEQYQEIDQQARAGLFELVVTDKTV